MTRRIRHRTAAALAAAVLGCLTSVPAAAHTAPAAHPAAAAISLDAVTAPVAPALPRAAAESCPHAYCVDVWASNVNVRPCPEVSTRCRPLPVKVGPQRVGAYCQARGGVVRDGGHVNDFWVQILAGRYVGWISAVYVKGGRDNEAIPGIPGPDSCP